MIPSAEDVDRVQNPSYASTRQAARRSMKFGDDPSLWEDAHAVFAGLVARPDVSTDRILKTYFAELEAEKFWLPHDLDAADDVIMATKEYQAELEGWDPPRPDDLATKLTYLWAGQPVAPEDPNDERHQAKEAPKGGRGQSEKQRGKQPATAGKGSASRSRDSAFPPPEDDGVNSRRQPVAPRRKMPAPVPPFDAIPLCGFQGKYPWNPKDLSTLAWAIRKLLSAEDGEDVEFTLIKRSSINVEYSDQDGVVRADSLDLSEDMHDFVDPDRMLPTIRALLRPNTRRPKKLQEVTERPSAVSFNWFVMRKGEADPPGLRFEPEQDDLVKGVTTIKPLDGQDKTKIAKAYLSVPEATATTSPPEHLDTTTRWNTDQFQAYMNSAIDVVTDFSGEFQLESTLVSLQPPMNEDQFQRVIEDASEDAYCGLVAPLPNKVVQLHPRSRPYYATAHFTISWEQADPDTVHLVLPGFFPGSGFPDTPLLKPPGPTTPGSELPLFRGAIADINSVVHSALGLEADDVVEILLLSADDAVGRNVGFRPLARVPRTDDTNAQDPGRVIDKQLVLACERGVPVLVHPVFPDDPNVITQHPEGQLDHNSFLVSPGLLSKTNIKLFRRECEQFRRFAGGTITSQHDHIRIRASPTFDLKGKFSIEFCTYYIGPKTTDAQWFSIRARIPTRYVRVSFTTEAEATFYPTGSPFSVWGPRYGRVLLGEAWRQPLPSVSRGTQQSRSSPPRSQGVLEGSAGAERQTAPSSPRTRLGVVRTGSATPGVITAFSGSGDGRGSFTPPRTSPSRCVCPFCRDQGYARMSDDHRIEHLLTHRQELLTRAGGTLDEADDQGHERWVFDCKRSSSRRCASASVEGPRPNIRPELCAFFRSCGMLVNFATGAQLQRHYEECHPDHARGAERLRALTSVQDPSAGAAQSSRAGAVGPAASSQASTAPGTQTTVENTDDDYPMDLGGGFADVESASGRSEQVPSRSSRGRATSDDVFGTPDEQAVENLPDAPAGDEEGDEESGPETTPEPNDKYKVKPTYVCSRCLRSMPNKKAIASDPGIEVQMSKHISGRRSCRIPAQKGTTEGGLPNMSGWLFKKDVEVYLKTLSGGIRALKQRFIADHPNYAETIWPADGVNPVGGTGPRSHVWAKDPNHEDRENVTWGMTWPPVAGPSGPSGGGDDDEDNNNNSRRSTPKKGKRKRSNDPSYRPTGAEPEDDDVSDGVPEEDDDDENSSRRKRRKTPSDPTYRPPKKDDADDDDDNGAPGGGPPSVAASAATTAAATVRGGRRKLPTSRPKGKSKASPKSGSKAAAAATAGPSSSGAGVEDELNDAPPAPAAARPRKRKAAAAGEQEVEEPAKKRTKAVAKPTSKPVAKAARAVSAAGPSGTSTTASSSAQPRSRAKGKGKGKAAAAPQQDDAEPVASPTPATEEQEEAPRQKKGKGKAKAAAAKPSKTTAAATAKKPGKATSTAAAAAAAATTATSKKPAKAATATATKKKPAKAKKPTTTGTGSATITIQEDGTPVINRGRNEPAGTDVVGGRSLRKRN
ncbi:hypothetical protein N3K66_008502 [Trichothecium roseum]|uniref:Uncharacterized protein n=1 Tax=Trichothecium roseum TaxID=47278 RepID=A0ACC0UQD8_9HYPO|nr:hypothetical protein N3K66_008502 [Trichothecium roseum]